MALAVTGINVVSGPQTLFWRRLAYGSEIPNISKAISIIGYFLVFFYWPNGPNWYRPTPLRIQ
jgi:hypothetical protein